LERIIEDWKELDMILGKLDIIKENDEKLFSELFNSNFVSCFLKAIVILQYTDPVTTKTLEKRFKKLALWVQNHKVGEFSQDDFWRAVVHVMHRKWGHDSINLDEELMSYSRLWRLCCRKPIYISLKNSAQSSLYVRIMNGMSGFAFGISGMLEEMEQLLDFCDGVVEHDGLSSNSKKSLLNEHIAEKNKELFYKCLKKNFFSENDTTYALTKAMEEKAYELIPMLLLKKYGEWPEQKEIRG
jgi:hypothetical protein